MVKFLAKIEVVLDIQPILLAQISVAKFLMI